MLQIIEDYCRNIHRKFSDVSVIMANNNNNQHLVQNDFTQAAANGNLQRLHELSDHQDVNINGRNKYGRNAIQVMTMTRPEVAEFLLGLGANPNEPDPDVGRTPLHDAAEHGHPDTVELLLKYGADPRLRDSARGNTPAHLAAGEGRPLRILELLSNGCTLRERNSAGLTPHDVAIAKGNEDAAEWIASYHSLGRGVRLMHLCRLTIHQALGTQRLCRIRELSNYPLPDMLVDFIKMYR
ncbi:uncharacterized protein [Asterias amurensis]|uniref:uncharacterized protein isoform X2 n=1 Tax=Asterias amurensis TaxID=7602 RepID=UPI003AB58448